MLREAGIRRGHRGPRNRPQTGWSSLTPTERTIAHLVAEGLSNPQIGERLYVSRRTVQTHIAHVFAKLHFTSRAQLASEVTRRLGHEQADRAGLAWRAGLSSASSGAADAVSYGLATGQVWYGT